MLHHNVAKLQEMLKPCLKQNVAGVFGEVCCNAWCNAGKLQKKIRKACLKKFYCKKNYQKSYFKFFFVNKIKKTFPKNVAKHFPILHHVLQKFADCCNVVLKKRI